MVDEAAELIHAEEVLDQGGRVGDPRRSPLIVLITVPHHLIRSGAAPSKPCLLPGILVPRSAELCTEIDNINFDDSATIVLYMGWNNASLAPLPAAGRHDNHKREYELFREMK